MNKIAATLIVAAMLAGGTGAVTNPPLTNYALGKTDADTWLRYVTCKGSYSGSVYTMQASGKDIYLGQDRGGFAYIETAKDFTFTARVRTARDLKENSTKWGVMVRQSLTCYDRQVSILYDSYKFCNIWFYRNKAGTTLSERGGEQFDAKIPNYCDPYGMTIKVVRKGPQITYYTKKGSGDYVKVDFYLAAAEMSIAPVMHTSTVYVGICASSGYGHAKDGKVIEHLITVEFDSIEFTENTTDVHYANSLRLTPTQNSRPVLILAPAYQAGNIRSVLLNGARSFRVLGKNDVTIPRIIYRTE